MSVLDPIRHARLIKDIDYICARAGIPKKFLELSMLGASPKSDIDWARNFFEVQQSGTAGMVMTGDNPEHRMMLLVAALLRNFVDASMMNLNTVLEAHKDGTLPDPTVLLIPNLFTVNVDTKHMAGWRIQQIHDLLLSRYTSGKLTIVYVENMDALKAQYGRLFYEHLSNCYSISEGDE